MTKKNKNHDVQRSFHLAWEPEKPWPSHKDKRKPPKDSPLKNGRPFVPSSMKPA